MFRLDDVQNHYNVAEASAIIDTFLSKNEVLNIGVIGGAFFGNDAAIVNKVTEAHAARCEVFNHGDDASTLFNDLTVAQAQQHISNGEVATFRPYTTFLPHENRWSTTTLKALRRLKYKAISPGVESSYPMAVNLGTRPLQLPQVTQTVIYAGGLWLSTIDQVLGDCSRALAEVGVCVVMMHPEEFANGQVTTAELADLIDSIRARGWVIRNFRFLKRQR